MNDHLTESQILERDQAKAKEMKHLKAQVLDEFFDNKQQELVQAFQSVSVGDHKTLIEIHHQYKSLSALYHEVQHVLNSGKLADAASKV